MAFDDLDDVAAEQDKEDVDEGEDVPDEESDVIDTETVDDAGMSDDVQEVETDEHLDEPAFEFADTKQDALYAREEAWDAFEDMLAVDLEGELRSRDLRDVPKREKHDAALRFAAEHPDEIADLIEATRR